MKHFSLTCIFLLGLSFFACNNNDDSDVKSSYIVKSLSHEWVTKTGDGAFETFSFESVPDDDLANFSDIVLHAFEDEVEYVSTAPNVPCWGNAVYAYPFPPSSKYPISNIKIVSSSTFTTENKVYEAGEELGAEFLYNLRSNQDFQLLSTVLESLSSDSTLRRVGCYIKFNGELAEPISQTFTVTFVYEDGSEVSTTTESIRAK